MKACRRARSAASLKSLPLPNDAMESSFDVQLLPGEDRAAARRSSRSNRSDQLGLFGECR